MENRRNANYEMTDLIKPSSLPIPASQKFHKFSSENIIYTSQDATIKNLEEISSNPTQIQINNLPTIVDAFIMLMDSNFRDYFYNTPSSVAITLSYDEKFTFLDENNKIELSNQFNDTQRSILITFRSSICGKSCICWRLKGRRQMLMIEVEEIAVEEFVVNFLLESMANGQSGVNQALDSDGTHQLTLDLQILTDPRNFNLLMLAAELGNAKVCNYFINRGYNINFCMNDETAADLAYKNRHSEALLSLLKANSTFPNNFDNRNLPDELKKFVLIGENLRKAVLMRNFDAVEEIVNKNPNLRHFYSIKNESILAFTLNDNALTIYEVLMQRNIFLGPHEILNDILEKMTENQRRKLREIHLAHAKDLTERHIMTLMANSSVSHEESDESDKLQLVLRTFKFLSKIESVQIVLKIVAAARNFKIFFDFNRENIQYLDPTAEMYTDGMFYLSGRILIAAKGLLDSSKEREVYGVIAHELTHYAMLLTYNNHANPYFEGDQTSITEFSKISTLCQQNMKKEKIISLVYECYDENQHHAELIVRVPQILTTFLGYDGTIAEISKEFPTLFAYYQQKCLPVMQTQLPVIQNRVENEIKAKIKRLRNKNVLLKKLLLLLAVALVASVVGVFYYFYEPDWIFSELSNRQKEKIFNGKINFQGKVKKFNELIAENSTAFHNLSSIEIRNFLNGNSINISEKFNPGDGFYVERNFIKRTEKQFDRAWNDSIHKYVQGEYNHEFVRNFDEISNETTKSKIFVLSDTAGAGKTTTFKNLVLGLKEKFPNFWISYVDLKKHVKTFKKFEKLDFEVETFIGKEILMSNGVQLEIFKDLFNKQKVVVFWDGLDEVSPTFEEFMTNLVSKVLNNTSNLQYISTRPQHTKNLEKTFNTTAYNLAVVTKSERKDFLIKFLSFRSLPRSEILTIIDKVELFIQQREEISRADDYFYEHNVNNIFMTILIAEVAADPQLTELFANLHLLYKFFVDKRIRKEIVEKGEIVQEEIGILSLTTSIKKIHQKYAIQLIVRGGVFKSYSTGAFDMKVADLAIMREDLSVVTDEKISKIGIVVVDANGGINFLHRTFAEYFYAQYLIDNVYFAVDVSEKEMERRLNMLFEVFDYKSYYVVRDFIRGFLQTQSSTKRQFNEAILELIASKYFRIIKNLPFYELFEKFFANDKKILQILTNPNDFTWLSKEFGKTPQKLPKIITGNLVENQRGNLLFWMWWSDKNGEKKLESLLKNVTKFEENKISPNLTIFEFFEKIEQLLSRIEYKEVLLSEPLDFFIQNVTQLRDFYKVWSKVETNLQKPEIQDFLTSKNDQNQTQLNKILWTGDEDLILEILQILKKFLNSSQICLILTSRVGSLQEPPLVGAAFKRTFDFNLKFLNFLESNLNETQIKEILLQTETSFWTSIFYSFANADNRVFALYRQIYEKHLTIHEFQTMFEQQHEGSIFIAVEFLVLNQRKQLTREFVNFWGGKFMQKKSSLKKIFGFRDELSGHTIFSKYEDDETFKPFVELGREIFEDKMEFSELFVKKKGEN